MQLFEITSRYQDLLDGGIKVVAYEKADAVKTFNHGKKVYVDEVTMFEKGNVHKTRIVWATEAIVKLGINKFICTAFECLSRDFEAILADEEIAE